MAAMVPQEALATLHRLREAYIQAVIHLDSLERDRRCEQSQASCLQTSDVLHTPAPAEHGAPSDGACPTLYHVCRLASARHDQSSLAVLNAASVMPVYHQMQKQQLERNSVLQSLRLNPLSKGDHDDVH